MKKILLPGILLSCLIAASNAQESGIPAVGTKGLIDHPFDYDGRKIQFEGEAIGDPMKRGGHAWVNVLDSNAAIGVFVASESLSSIGIFGSYKAKGDTLRVRGVFHRACPDHGGDMDIHASSIEAIEKGHGTPHPVDRLELILTLAFILIASVLFAIWRKREGSAKTESWLS
jgi:hypothetical protein